MTDNSEVPATNQTQTATSTLSKEVAPPQTSGALYAVGAYTAWGFVPVYWKFLTAFSAIELISHRIVWAFFFYWLLAARKSNRVWGWLSAFKDKKRTLAILAAAALLTTNWLIYVWAIQNNHVVEASLGYFITPLLNVLTGYIVLKEKLSKTKWISLAFAALGVTVLAVQTGQFPWIAVSLALTFSTYGLIRKQLSIDVLHASTAETAAVFLPAFAFVIYQRNFAIGSHEATALEFGLLAISGVITGLPLIWFAQAARKLPLSTLGFFQYIAPSIQFVLGVFVYGEPFTSAKLWAFVLIWIALGIFSRESLISWRREKKRKAGDVS